ncbi:hypothetical protein ABFS83_06G123400 [Erythranthe nasuta]
MKRVPYANAIGSVMYLMVSTRPDIAYYVSCLSRYMYNPGLPHWEALKWLLRYLKGTVNTGLMFSKGKTEIELCGYVDSNFANDRDNRKSSTSYVFTLNGACVCWKSQFQNIVALSTTEFEYIAATETIKEAIWLKGLFQSGIQLCKNPFHFICDVVEKGVIDLEKIPSEFNPADMGTKCLPSEKLCSCLKNLNILSKP